MPTNTPIAPTTVSELSTDTDVSEMTSQESRIFSLAFSVIAAVYVALGLVAIATLGWTELYADQWRLYPLYIELPFPQNVLVLENGHRPIFPAMLRVLELWLFHGLQWLQLGVGAMLALTTFFLIAALIRTDRSTSRQLRWTAIAVAAFAVFWLGNARMLLHGNESVHAYLLTACLAGAIALVQRKGNANRDVWSACVLAFIATFSFGPGLAVFPTLALLLTLQRRWSALAVVATSLVATIVVYFVLPGGSVVRDTLRFDPIVNIQVGAAWLASAWVTLLNALLEPGANQSLPAAMHSLTRLVSERYADAFGSPYRHPLAYAWISLTAIGYIVWVTLTSWRRLQYNPIRFTGLGLAWFAIGVAGIVSLGRSAYFDANPDQIFANRYLPWSCLFWLGIFLVWIGAPSHSPRCPRRLPIILGGILLAAGLLTSRGYWIWGDIVQQGIRLNAAGVASGVIDAEQSLGETVYEQLASGLPSIRSAQVSMFAWPETQLLRQRIATTESKSTPRATTRKSLIHNRLNDKPALRLELDVHGAMKSEAPARLLALADDIAVGILIRQHSASSNRYVGYAQAPDGASIKIGTLGEHNKLECWVGCD